MNPTIDSIQYYFINSSTQKINKPKEQFLNSIAKHCTANYTKLDDMLSLMMDSTDDDCINLLVSDYVFTTQTGNLATASSSITTLFSNKLKEKDLAVAITKYMTNFNGKYYPGGLLCKKPLPLYVWAFGNKKNIQTFIELPLNSKNCGTFYLQKPSNPTYSIDAKNKRMIDSNNNVIVSKWNNERNKDYYELKLKAKFSDILLVEDDILNKKNYMLESNTTSQYMIYEINALENGYYEYVLRTKIGYKPSPGRIVLKYPMLTPNWVENSNFEGSGIPSDSTTYGISSLINGVSKAYRHHTKDNQNYFAININLI